MKIHQHPHRGLRVRGARGGFSLAELMVVIVIIGLLVTVVVPNVMQKVFKGYDARVKLDMSAIEAALDEYAMSNGMKYPDSLERLVEKDKNGYSYLKTDSVPLDPWKNEYIYEPPTLGEEYKLFSLGADGQPGGEGKDADILLSEIKKQ